MLYPWFIDHKVINQEAVIIRGSLMIYYFFDPFPKYATTDSYGKYILHSNRCFL